MCHEPENEDANMSCEWARGGGKEGGYVARARSVPRIRIGKARLC